MKSLPVHLLALLISLAILAASPARAAADTVCLDRSRMIDTLIKDYGEQLTEVQEIKGTGLLEFHVSPTDGTWTAILTDEDNWSCVLATGEGLDPSKAIITISGQRI